MTGVAAHGPTELSIVDRLRRAGCVFAEDEADVLIRSAASGEQLESMVERRGRGEPLEHVVGWADFAGVTIVVDPGVFVPRRRSELLVRCAERAAREAGGAGAVLLDLCCGSGAIAVAVAARVAGLVLHAADIEPAAIRCARRNVEPLGGTVTQSDLFQGLPRHLLGAVDVVVCNAPYVPDAAIATLPREAREHEPRVTLSGGADGLAVQRRVVQDAEPWMSPIGRLLVETSAAQAPATAALFTSAGFLTRIEHDDELDATVVIGSAAATAGARRTRSDGSS